MTFTNAPSMGEAAGHDRLQRWWEVRHVPRQRIAHLDGRWQIELPSAQHVGQVFAGVLGAGEEQHDPPLLKNPDDPAGEYTGPLGRNIVAVH